jgi:hypothetical protein
MLVVLILGYLDSIDERKLHGSRCMLYVGEKKIGAR